MGERRERRQRGKRKKPRRGGNRTSLVGLLVCFSFSVLVPVSVCTSVRLCIRVLLFISRRPAAPYFTPNASRCATSPRRTSAVSSAPRLACAIVPWPSSFPSTDSISSSLASARSTRARRRHLLRSHCSLGRRRRCRRFRLHPLQVLLQDGGVFHALRVPQPQPRPRHPEPLEPRLEQGAEGDAHRHLILVQHGLARRDGKVGVRGAVQEVLEEAANQKNKKLPTWILRRLSKRVVNDGRKNQACEACMEGEPCGIYSRDVFIGGGRGGVGLDPVMW